ncbi:unnamed protein product [Nippostrongylus brasiliensis]|uniref:BAR domain-containing protein n=1 Tax=Nippostrongylus brasiliensis TaxID=27835 RepID=A0A0N4YLN2_NIPBR|nr:unnamed protein product [Nippostrongylus brasiliensis]
MAAKTQSKSNEKDREKSLISSKNSVKGSAKDSQLSRCPGFVEGGKGVVGQIDDGESANKKAIKKFLHRIKENIGIAERTEFSKTLTDAFEQMDKYKLCLDTLNETACRVIQENPAFRKMDQKVELAPPQDQDPYETVRNCLILNKTFEDYKDQKVELAPPQDQDPYETVRNCLILNKTFEDYKNYKDQVNLYTQQAAEHRDYIQRARRALHNIRTFVQHDYWVIAILRTESIIIIKFPSISIQKSAKHGDKFDMITELDNLRAEMDFAKSELKTAKEPQLLELKNKMYKQAVTAFEAKLKEVTKQMDEFPKSKESHVADIIELTNYTRTYHESMAKILKS